MFSYALPSTRAQRRSYFRPCVRASASAVVPYFYTQAAHVLHGTLTPLMPFACFETCLSKSQCSRGSDAQSVCMRRLN